MITRLFAGLLALECRAPLIGATVATVFLGFGNPHHALSALFLILTHDLLSQRLRRR